MSHHNSDADAAKSSPIKIAIIVSIGTLVMIVGIVLLAYFAVGTHAVGGDGNTFGPEQTAARIAPVAKLVVEPAAANTSAPIAPGKQPPTAAVVVPVAIPAATPAGKADGKSVYATACAVCHTAGIAGAPKLGDKIAWAPRIKTGNEALYTSAIKGKGAMPAKGGYAALADAEVKAAVDYLLAQAK